ncbi:Uncharacterised protein [Enterobacter cloacae]|nr:Uncharacterised protein [Enterobacter cloacae]
MFGAAVNKEAVANGGGDQAQQQDLLNTKAFGKERQSEHEEDFRELAEGHPAGGVFHPHFGEIAVGKDVVESQRHGEQE